MLILIVGLQLARLFFSLCVAVTPKPTQMNAWQGLQETGISHQERVIDPLDCEKLEPTFP